MRAVRARAAACSARASCVEVGRGAGGRGSGEGWDGCAFKRERARLLWRLENKQMRT